MFEPDAPARETLDWATYGRAVRTLAQKVANDGYRPDVVLGVARGGLFAAGSLGYALAVKNLMVMNVEFYSGVDERLEAPMMLPPYIDVAAMNDQRVLVVDDVADTGETLELVGNFCRGHVADVRFAVIYEKPRSIIKCEYVWKHTELWINFPWSTEPPVVDRLGVVLDA